MHKKVTIKDVAREAGVSVATVSYVINNREDQKISPETRNKVLQMINLLNYRPNQAAKSLVTQKRQLIALYYKEHSSVLKRAEQLHFITQLSAFLYTKHYHLICLNQEYIGKYDVADVILTLEVTKKGNILVIDDTVNHILSKHKNKLYLPSISEAKLLKLFQAIEWASKREAINNHNILV
ncbi:LacI family DNA-binding transcriptional regulator [Streptococcus equi subsp. equi]|uniref:LacI family DNA-binding transcriptional regulator n=1 Tax=Streptococcus equi TaxID=1336 RepID=UPI001BEB6062|nr:LacI family DNA-binding transcriptional regulator [Streptococcus equi]QWB18422.1 LacI family DNA-binding transcriptional regulator [Streptococcus equi subsp. equi]QWB40392.1 LacI family DNA-binding transcriptional regulator [Streptococcus equi subsp. equi]